MRYVSYNSENFGHFISDELFPIFALLDGFDAYKGDDVQFIRLPMADYLYSCDWQIREWGEVTEIIQAKRISEIIFYQREW